jgi:hypothetical protein
MTCWWPGRHLHFLTTYIHMRRNNSWSWHSDSVVVLSNYYLLLACYKPKHQSKAKSTCEIIRKRWVTICCLVGDKRQSPSPPYVLTRNRLSWFARIESAAVGTSLTSLTKSHDFLIATTWDVLFTFHVFLHFFSILSNVSCSPRTWTIKSGTIKSAFWTI